MALAKERISGKGRERKRKKKGWRMISVLV
jgi:hypothetical protein